MANLLKASKRGGLLPRIANGGIATGERYGEWPEGRAHERGEMPPMLYTLDVAGVRYGDVEADEYQVQLTEDEMIRACGEWLSKLASRRSREKFDARNKTAREAARG